MRRRLATRLPSLDLLVEYHHAAHSTARPGPAPQADDDIRYAAHLRGLNLERVLAVARDRPGPFTRAELIEATGLSAPTVGSLAVVADSERACSPISAPGRHAAAGGRRRWS